MSEEAIIKELSEKYNGEKITEFKTKHEEKLRVIRTKENEAYDSMYNFILNTMKNTKDIESGDASRCIKLKYSVDITKCNKINLLISKIETTLPIKFKIYTLGSSSKYQSDISYDNSEGKFICNIYNNTYNNTINNTFNTYR